MKIYEFREADAFTFARHVGAETKVQGGELFFKICPYCRPRPTHGNTRTFSINLQTGQFKCLRASCGVSGNMITLSRDFDFSLGNEADEYYRPRRQYRKLKTPKEPIRPKEAAVRYLEAAASLQRSPTGMRSRHRRTTITCWCSRSTTTRETCSS